MPGKNRRNDPARRTVTVVYVLETDGETLLKEMKRSEVEPFMERLDLGKGSAAVVDGGVLKGFDSDVVRP